MKVRSVVMVLAPLVLLAGSCAEDANVSQTRTRSTSAPSTSVSSTSAPSASVSGSPAVRAVATKGVVLYQGGGIFTAPVSGGPSTLLSGAVPEAEHPDWSPNGSAVVFESAFSTVYTVVGDGSAAPVELWKCARPCHSVQDAAWSPDGSEIAVVTAESKDGTRTSRSSVLAIDVASRAARTVVADQSGRVWFFAPRWSGDGTRLVIEKDTYASDRLDESSVTEISLIIAPANGGSPPQQIASWRGPIVGLGSPSPDWNRQQNLVAYVRDDNIHLIRPDGTDDRKLTNYDGTSERAIQPTFTPDGTALAFTHVQTSSGSGDSRKGSVIDLQSGRVEPLAKGVGLTHPRIRP